MILSDKVRTKSSKYYGNLGYDISERYILVDIKHLQLGSNSIIRYKCDYCSSEGEISYKSYNKNVKISFKYACSTKCGSLKSKESNLLKYGVESLTNLESTKEKRKNSNLEKYGVEHISQLESIRKLKSDKMKSQSDEVSKRVKHYYSNLTKDDIKEISDKRKSSNLEKYGVEHISQLDNIKERVKDTVNSKYGGFTYQSDELMDKVKSTNLEKYGFDYASKNEDIKDKMKLTNLERYGFDYASKSDNIKEKSIKTNFKKYGVSNIMLIPSVVENLNERFISKYGTNSYFKTQEFKDSLKYNPMSNDNYRKDLIISNHPNYIGYISNELSEFSCDKGELHQFKINSINFHNRISLGKNICTICNPIGSQTSISENELFSYIKSVYNGKVISSYRDGLEIDIYLPNLDLGFEFNGLYWHSIDYKDKNYHRDKLEYFSNKGIRIFNIWEDDWDLRRDIVKSQISNLLKLNTNKIWARNCIIKDVESKEAKSFLGKNHIQGHVRSMIRIGLYYKNELISLMTFDNSEGRNKMKDGEWNLSRFCSKINTSVIGGASRLLNYFIKKYNSNRIISFADMDWSLGDLYYKLGFKLINTLKPDYKYIVNRERVNKQRFTKEKLYKLGYDIKKTESIITKEMGLKKIYNCGQLKFELFI